MGHNPLTSVGPREAKKWFKSVCILSKADPKGRPTWGLILVSGVSFGWDTFQTGRLGNRDVKELERSGPRLEETSDQVPLDTLMTV